jgi:hypothetical protein
MSTDEKKSASQVQVQTQVKNKGKNYSNYYCKYYMEGYCPFGRRCYGKHIILKKGYCKSIPCDYFLKNIECPNEKNGNCWFSHYIPENYKTEICRNVFTRGYCHRGDKCTFAHSKDELRTKKND